MRSSLLPQKSLKRRRPSFAATLVVTSLAGALGLAHGEIRLSSDWSSDDNLDGTRKPREQNDGTRFLEAADTASYRRDARATVNGPRDSLRLAFGTKLFVDEVKYFVRPAMFMSKSRPDEVCTPERSLGTLAYRCEEGQRLTSDCHLMFFDGKFAEAGFNTVKLNEPYQFFCNAVPSIAVRSRGSHDLLITVQYFPIDQKLASKASEIGSGWNRMTVLFHIKAVDGKIVAEQDDSCLGNPNRIGNIPDARKRLAKCLAGSVLKR